MKKTFLLSGLGCANCASKMQDKITKLDGVNSAAVNFITTKLTIDGEDGKMDAIVESAKSIIKKIEPDVVMRAV